MTLAVPLRAVHPHGDHRQGPGTADPAATPPRDLRPPRDAREVGLRAATEPAGGVGLGLPSTRSSWEGAPSSLAMAVNSMLAGGAAPSSPCRTTATDMVAGSVANET